MDAAEQINELIDQAWRDARGRERVRLLEEAVRLADGVGELEWQYELREMLIDAAYDSGDADKLMNAMSWCMATHDAHPHRFDDQTFLLQSQLALQYINSFANVTRQQIEELFDDIDRRHQAYGASPRAMRAIRCFNAFWMGDIELARELYAGVWSLPTDDVSKDDVWEQLMRIDFHIHIDRPDVAAREAKAYCERHRLDTAYDWVGSFGLAPLFVCGDEQTAHKIHRQIYPRIAKDTRLVDLAADHIEYLCAAGYLDNALSLFEKHFAWTFETPTERQVFEFYAAAVLLFECLQSDGRAEVQLDIPPEFPIYESAGTYQLAILHDWFVRETNALAARFNARNGNNYYNQIVKRVVSLKGG